MGLPSYDQRLLGGVMQTRESKIRKTFRKGEVTIFASSKLPPASHGQILFKGVPLRNPTLTALSVVQEIRTCIFPPAFGGTQRLHT